MNIDIGIVGMGPSADVVDGDGYDLWGMGQDPLADIKGCKLLFDCHDYYTGHVCKSLPIMTQENYPLDNVIKYIGRDYFGSTFGYMLAYAIYLEVNKIKCWGVDLDKEEEYIHQRPNAEWLIGIAEGRGINVDIATGSSLMQPVNGRYCWT
jgi:hypothetical protein